LRANALAQKSQALFPILKQFEPSETEKHVLLEKPL